jgi:transposase
MFLPASLDDYISIDNETRNIDLFVYSLNLEVFGFKMKKVDDGRPAYHPSVLLKLFIFGYLNRIRSSKGPHPRKKDQTPNSCLSNFYVHSL